MAETYSLLLQQLPQHVLENYPTFGKFLDFYYRWLNTRGFRSLEDIMNIDKEDRVMVLRPLTRRLIVEYLDQDNEFKIGDKDLYMEGFKTPVFVLAKNPDGTDKYDANGDPVYAITGEKIIDHIEQEYVIENGELVYEEITDEDGNVQFEPMRDALGSAITDDFGNVIPSLTVILDTSEYETGRRYTGHGEDYRDYLYKKEDPYTRYYLYDDKSGTYATALMTEKIANEWPVYKVDTDQDGNVIYEVAYDIFGETIYEDGTPVLRPKYTYAEGTEHPVIKQQYKRDENGNIVYEVYRNSVTGLTFRDGDGNPVYHLDQNGKKIPVYEPVTEERPVATIFSISNDYQNKYISIELNEDEHGERLLEATDMIGQTVYIYPRLNGKDVIIENAAGDRAKIEAKVVGIDDRFTLIGKTLWSEEPGDERHIKRLPARVEVLAIDDANQYIVRRVTMDEEFQKGDIALVSTGSHEWHDRYLVEDYKTVPNVFMEHFSRMLDADQIFDIKSNPKIATILKKTKQLYRAKGTEEALEYFIHMVYDADVDIHYPREQMLRFSDGKWECNTAVAFRNIRGLFPFKEEDIPIDGDEGLYTQWPRIDGFKFINYGGGLTADGLDDGKGREVIYAAADYESFTQYPEIHRVWFTDRVNPYIKEHAIAYYIDDNGVEIDVWEGEVIGGVTGIEILSGGGKWMNGQIFEIGGSNDLLVESDSYDTISVPWYERHHENMDNGLLFRVSHMVEEEIENEDGTTDIVSGGVSLLDIMPDDFRDFKITSVEIDGSVYEVGEFFNDPQTNGVFCFYLKPNSIYEYEVDADGNYVIDARGNPVPTSVIDVYPSIVQKYVYDKETFELMEWDGQDETDANEIRKYRTNGFQLYRDKTDLDLHHFAVAQMADKLPYWILGEDGFTVDEDVFVRDLPYLMFNPTVKEGELAYTDDIEFKEKTVTSDEVTCILHIEYTAPAIGEIPEHVISQDYECNILSSSREYGISGTTVTTGNYKEPLIAKVTQVGPNGIATFATIIKLGSFIDIADADKIYTAYPKFENENYSIIKLDCSDETAAGLVDCVISNEDGARGQVVAIDYVTKSDDADNYGVMLVVKSLDVDYEFHDGDSVIVKTNNGIEKLHANVIGIDSAASHAIEFRLKFGAAYSSAGKWKDDSGKISNNYIRIQDSYYYQDLSYDIRSEVDPNEYISIAKYLHPAGLKMFTTYILNADIDFTLCHPEWGPSIELARFIVSLWDIVHATDAKVVNGEEVPAWYNEYDEDGNLVQIWDRGSLIFSMAKAIFDDVVTSEVLTFGLLKHVFDDVLTSEKTAFWLRHPLQDNVLSTERRLLTFKKANKDVIKTADELILNVNKQNMDEVITSDPLSIQVKGFSIGSRNDFIDKINNGLFDDGFPLYYIDENGDRVYITNADRIIEDPDNPFNYIANNDPKIPTDLLDEDGDVEMHYPWKDIAEEVGLPIANMNYPYSPKAIEQIMHDYRMEPPVIAFDGVNGYDPRRIQYIDYTVSPTEFMGEKYDALMVPIDTAVSISDSSWCLGPNTDYQEQAVATANHLWLLYVEAWKDWLNYTCRIYTVKNYLVPPKFDAVRPVWEWDTMGATILRNSMTAATKNDYANYIGAYRAWLATIDETTVNAPPLSYLAYAYISDTFDRYVSLWNTVEDFKDRVAKIKANGVKTPKIINIKKPVYDYNKYKDLAETELMTYSDYLDNYLNDVELWCSTISGLVNSLERTVLNPVLFPEPEWTQPANPTSLSDHGYPTQFIDVNSNPNDGSDAEETAALKNEQMYHEILIDGADDYSYAESGTVIEMSIGGNHAEKNEGWTREMQRPMLTYKA